MTLSLPNTFLSNCEESVHGNRATNLHFQLLLYFQSTCAGALISSEATLSTRWNFHPDATRAKSVVSNDCVGPLLILLVGLGFHRIGSDIVFQNPEIPPSIA